MKEEELQIILNTIHFSISPARIHRYDIFKRYCFDARIIKKAFPEYLDGLKFYEECFLNDNSFYIKQQCALYLSELGEHEIAFKYIDEARSMSLNKNLSIRNSFAVIQFKANINKKVDDGVLKTLDESMQILSECYKFDTRKRIHARAFATQALDYTQKTNFSAKSLGYIEKAIPWLESQLADRPHDRHFKQLARRLNQVIRHRKI
jgi:tetratricopeptide (TPR) repeat protein